MVVEFELFIDFQDAILRGSDVIPVTIFREVITACNEINQSPENFDVDLNESPVKCNLLLDICNTLEKFIIDGFARLENQFVCASAMCGIISILPIDMKEARLDIIYGHLQLYTQHRERFREEIYLMPHSVNTMSLINGLYNSNVLNHRNLDLVELSENILRESLEIVLVCCVSFNSFTSISFKNLSAIVSKIVDWKIEFVMTADMMYTIMIVMYNNWENPISSVRDLIAKTFNKCFSLLNTAVDHFLENLVMFPWTRGKYYTLCELIPYLNFKALNFLFLNTCCLNGLKLSLSNQALVTAGANLYRVLLNKYCTFDEWYVVFYKTFVEILSGKDRMMKKNVLTYWMPWTIKFHPQVIYMLINSFFEAEINDEVLYSFLFILKHGRKGGHILKSWRDLSVSTPEGNIIVRGLHHINEDIRGKAIEVMSAYSSYTILPTYTEIDLMKDFIICNINTDSTTFRQTMMKSLSNFILILRDSFVHVYIRRKANIETLHKVKFEDFFKWLQEFLLENLMNCGNYQRKITSLQLLGVILKYMHGDEIDPAQIENRKIVQKVKEYLEDRQKWLLNSDRCIIVLLNCINDNSKDIKDTAVDILSMYYLDQPYLRNLKNSMFIKALVACNSTLFYENDSGSASLKLLGYLGKVEGCYDVPIERKEDEEPIHTLDYLSDKMERQSQFYFEDIPFALYNNEPLHGLIGGINAYLTVPGVVVQIKSLKALLRLTKSITETILDILARKSVNKLCPPSFCEITESINEMILYSENSTPPTDDEELLKTHQLVMNNMWLVLKACCELANTIIVHHNDKVFEQEEIEASLNIHISVLKRCRLKGAIEFAGTSLGSSIKFLTKIQRDPYRDLLNQIVNDVVFELIYNPIGSSITRRSAGLSILAHRCAASDSRPSKLLYYTVLSGLLNFFNSNDQPNEPFMLNDMSIDNPKATILHALSRIVKDSSLLSVNLKYLSRLAIVCFKHMVSDQWQVRNAALQLHGALVPRLVGQQSSSDNPDAPISADELFAHFPALWEYIVERIQEATTNISPSVTFAKHSDLIPILTLLASMAKRNNYTLFKFVLFVRYEKDVQEILTELPRIDDIFDDLIRLLSSPICTVRKLSAKIIENFFTADTFHKHWVEYKATLNSENELHGYLMLLRYYVRFFNYIRDFKPNYYTFESSKTLDGMLLEMGQIISTRKSSVVLKSLFVNTIYDLGNYHLIDHLKILSSCFNHYNSLDDTHIGVFNWIEVCVFNTLAYCDESLVDAIITKSLEKPSLTMQCAIRAVKYRLDNDLIKQPETIVQLNQAFYTELIRGGDFRNDIIEVIYALCLNPLIDASVLYKDEHLEVLYDLFEVSSEFYYDYGYLLPLLSLLGVLQYEKRTTGGIVRFLLRITALAKKLSQIELYPTHVRYFTALSLPYLTRLASNERLANLFSKADSFSIKYNVLSTHMRLLQDEDSDIRYECSKSIYFEEKYSTHPSRYLNIILSESFLMRYFFKSQRRVIKAMEALNVEINELEKKKLIPVSIPNPFESDTKNIYWELSIIKQKTSFLMMKFKGMAQTAETKV